MNSVFRRAARCKTRRMWRKWLSSSTLDASDWPIRQPIRGGQIPAKSRAAFASGALADKEKLQSRLQSELNVEQSIKKGVPVPQIDSSLVSWHSVIGRRTKNEDRVSVETLAPNTLLVGLFDGHGSALAADFTSSRLADQVASWLRHTHNLQTCLSQAFVDINNLFCKFLFQRLAQKTDADMPTDRDQKSGTTAVCVVLRNSQELVMASVGDSSALLCRQGVAQRLNRHHCPDQPSELKRINQRGGFIVSNSFGQILVNGRLSMSRSIGDPDFKCYGVTANPNTISREVRHHKDQFVLLVTDGISNVMSDQDMCNIVLHSSSPQEACHLLTDIALQYGSDDNSTVLVLPLGAWGKDVSSEIDVNPLRGLVNKRE